jgi:hypothetical protein
MRGLFAPRKKQNSRQASHSVKKKKAAAPNERRRT